MMDENRKILSYLHPKYPNQNVLFTVCKHAQMSHHVFSKYLSECDHCDASVLISELHVNHNLLLQN